MLSRPASGAGRAFAFSTQLSSVHQSEKSSPILLQKPHEVTFSYLPGSCMLSDHTDTLSPVYKLLIHMVTQVSTLHSAISQHVYKRNSDSRMSKSQACINCCNRHALVIRQAFLDGINVPNDLNRSLKIKITCPLWLSTGFIVLMSIPVHEFVTRHA